VYYSGEERSQLDEISRSDRINNLIPEDADAIYALVASGADFYFYQDLGNDAYDEHYFNPDCVLLFPDTRRLYWFDLDHLSVGSDPSGVRRHSPWNLWRRKFAFSYPGNEMTVLVYTLLHSKISNVTPMRSQPRADVKYMIAERYTKLSEFSADGEEFQEYGVDLQSAWKSNRKMKIGVKLGQSILIFPVRLAFRQKGIYSFASKTVAIPSLSAKDFSWHDASIGNICVASDGSCSIYRTKKPRNSFNNLLATCFPNSVNYAHRIFSHSENQKKELIKSNLRRYCGPVLRKYAAPFRIEYLKCPFVIFGRESP
jgi:hypothetical protein